MNVLAHSMEEFLPSFPNALGRITWRDILCMTPVKAGLAVAVRQLFSFCRFRQVKLFAVAIWPVTGQGVKNAKWPAVPYSRRISQNLANLNYHTSIKTSQAILKCLMHQSIPPAPRPPPGWPPGISIFFALDGKFPGVGTLELSNSPGWGRKKRANALSSVNTATFFIDRTVEYCHFKHFNVRFFVSINVFRCNSAMILIKTPRDDMHQFMVLV